MTPSPELMFAISVLATAYQNRAFRLFTAEGMCTYMPAAAKA